MRSAKRSNNDIGKLDKRDSSLVWSIEKSYKTISYRQAIHSPFPSLFLPNDLPQTRRVRWLFGLRNNVRLYGSCHRPNHSKTSSSVRFIIFDKYADIVAQHQLEFPQYYPNPGCVCGFSPSYSLNNISPDGTTTTRTRFSSMQTCV